MQIIPFPTYRCTCARRGMSANAGGIFQQLMAADTQREIDINRALHAMVAAREAADIPGAYAAQDLMTVLIKGRSARAAWRERGLANQALRR